MSKWMRALAKAGLVELEGAEAEAARQDTASDEDLDRMMAESEALLSAVGADPEPAPAPPAVPLGEVVEGVELSGLYASAAIPQSPFPAEKLLKVLEGLKALAPATRKAAILAMDSADEVWTIQDPLLDAVRKIDALRQAQAQLDATITSAEARAQQELAQHEAYKEQATSTIRSQIAELEQLLASELTEVAEKKAAVHASLQETRAACTRESARYEAEVDRLQSLSITFPDES